MVNLGHTHYNKYIVWITQPHLSTIKDYHQEVDKLPFFEVILVKKEKHCLISIDIATDNNFRFVMNLSDNNQPTELTDIIQYKSYLNRKGNNLFFLSKNNVEALLNKCEELSNI